MRPLIVAAFLMGLIAAPAGASSTNCSDAIVLTSGCTTVDGSLGEGAAVITGTSEGTNDSSESQGGGGEVEVCDAIVGDRCFGGTIPKGGAGDVELVTLSDVASFRPVAPVQRMEPAGWAVVGLDTNFFALVEQQVRDGTLLGQAASVRFTPVAYRWDYGDGTTATRSAKGAAWEALGIPEFEPTPTSHVYRAAGRYVVRLRVAFTAEYRFAGGAFVPIAGQLSVAANDLVVDVGSATTVLVERDCQRDPRGPGC